VCSTEPDTLCMQMEQCKWFEELMCDGTTVIKMFSAYGFIVLFTRCVGALCFDGS
jgi:hypothetical protein